MIQRLHIAKMRFLSAPALLLALTVLLSGCGLGTAAEVCCAKPEKAPVTAVPESAAPKAAPEPEPTASIPPEPEAPVSPEPEENASAAAQESGEAGEDGVLLPGEGADFVLLTDVVPDAILEIRYFSTYNFVGDRIDGYEQPVALLTRAAAEALKAVSDELLPQGYRLKIYDAYRPQTAVDHFVRWAADASDTRMKPFFYPEKDKSVLFAQGYIASLSGHSRGSTVDLTLFDMHTGEDVDMGGAFDYFGPLSHPDYTGITAEQYQNRMLLREAMLRHGFLPLDTEWWHFTLENEPYPDTYFTFPVSEDSVR